MGQDSVLLRLVEAMDFVDEEDGPLPVHAETVRGLADDSPQFGNSGGNRANGNKMGPGCVRDEPGNRRFP
jgi:hypothetical protein